MSTELQIRLVTKQNEYAVPDTEIVVADTITVKELNLLVHSFLNESGNDCIEEFDFLALGELVRTSLLEHIQLRNGSTESLLEIEYFVKYPAPSPENSLMHDDWISSVEAKDNWILCGCYDNTIHIWNVDGQHKLTIPAHAAPVKAVAWLNREEDHYTFISTSHDENAILWKWNQISNSVDCIHVCKGHIRSVDCVAVNPTFDRFATGSYDLMLKIWSTADENEPPTGDEDRKRFKADGKTKLKSPLMTLSGHTEGICDVQWIDTNEIVTASLDCTLKIWDMELGGLKHQMNGSKAFLGISYSPISRLIVSGSSDRHIRLWDPRTKDGTLVKSVFSSHNMWITSLHWSPNDEYQFISGSMDKLVKLWDTRSPKTPLFDISGHEDKVLAVDWSLKNLIVSGGADNQLKLYKFQESMEQ